MFLSFVVILSWTNMCSACWSDVVFLMDHSGSIFANGPTNWDTMIDFTVDIARTLGVSQEGNRIAAAGFGNAATLYFDFLKFSSAEDFAQQANDVMEYRTGLTNLTGGLRLVRTSLLTPEAGDRADAGNIIIVLTDGAANAENEYLRHEASRLKYMNNTIIAIGITDMIDEEQLTQIVVSWPPMKHFFKVDQFEELTIILNSIIVETCSDNPLGEQICHDVDVMILVEAAGVSTVGKFAHISNFMQELVATGEQQMRFGVATFSDLVHEEWSIGDVEQEQLSQLCDLPGHINSTEVFRYILDDAFQSARPNTTKVAVIITDKTLEVNEHVSRFVNKIHEAGIGMRVVSVGCQSRLSDLESLLKQELLSVIDYRDLHSILHPLMNILCAG